MSEQNAVYDSAAAKELSIDTLINIFQGLGVSRVIYKHLAPNDNSKNQPYLAGHFTDIGYIPTGKLAPSRTTSKKTSDPKRQVKFTADLEFYWVGPDGTAYHAPTAKLIYYPQFPEVRLSGFLKGCQADLGEWMDPGKQGRARGRVLFFGIKNPSTVYAYLAIPGSRIAAEVDERDSLELSSVLREIFVRDPAADAGGAQEVLSQLALFVSDSSTADPKLSSRQLLIKELARIHDISPVASKRLNRYGAVMPYTARNGGGYTLEAELGVIPNGIAEPDFHGWEIKQFGVVKFSSTGSKVLTVMTPEPDGGFYGKNGTAEFVRRYGYLNENKHDRMDFTGRHFAGEVCSRSQLKMQLSGFDGATNTLIDAEGYIGLTDSHDNVAASWSFAKLIDHWKRKHAKAAYVPSIQSTLPEGRPAYTFGNEVRLFEGTSFDRLLGAIASKKIYYDPGMKIENLSTKPKSKPRSQFRIKSKDLDCLYVEQEVVDVTSSV